MASTSWRLLARFGEISVYRSTLRGAGAAVVSRPLFYRLLESPLVYSLSQSLLLPGAGFMLGDLFRRTLGQSAGWVLDVGCGPELSTPSPDGGRVVGVDINPRYVGRFVQFPDRHARYVRTRSKARARSGVVGSATELPFPDGRFDESRCLGLLHHLTDDAVRAAVSEMYRVVKGSGRVIILDNVWPRSAARRPLAWAVRRLDRGEWVRSEAALKALVESAAPARWRAERMTYTLTGLELLLMECTVGDRDRGQRTDENRPPRAPGAIGAGA